MKLQPLTSLEKKLRAALPALGVKPTSTVLVGVSGGADSVALLDALVRWQRKLRAPGQIAVAHLNHQLRGAESEEDEQFVRALATRWELPVVIERAAVKDEARTAGQNLEATARRLRYQFLQRAAVSCNAQSVCTAHTQDDQAETVLMRLLRGSGVEGLRGIFPQVDLAEGVRLLRPLLQVTRAEVLTHCAAYDLAYRTDSSNFSSAFTRNRIRHEVLPLLQTFNPRCAEALARTADAAATEELYWQAEVSRCLRDVRQANTSLALPKLLPLPVALRRRLWRHWFLETTSAILESIHVAALERLLIQGQSGQVVELPGGWRVLREFGEIRLVQVQTLRQNTPGPLAIIWQTDEPTVFGGYQLKLVRGLSWSAAMALRTGMTGNEWALLLRDLPDLARLCLRTRHSGDAYVPAGRHQAVKLKTLLIRHKIAKTERDAWPLIVTQSGALIGGPGLPVAASFVAQVRADGANVALLMVRKE